jgi:NAD(P)-dependent dehydrogenase (short-subunit alcohol dehydrogenase family)
MSRVAIITGGAQGLGAAFAKQFLSDGMSKVVLADRSLDGLQSVARSLGGLDRIATVHADLRDDKTPDRLIDTAIERFGRVDVVLNAAGNTQRWSVENVTPDAYREMFDVNVKAPLFLLQAAARVMPPGSVVINISSMLAYGGPPDIGIYATSKAALVGLTKNAANALKGKGIRVFAINLGWANTEGEHEMQTKFHGRPDDWAETVGRKVPFGRLISSDDVAGVCAFLISPSAQMMTGAVIDYEQMPAGAYDFHPMVKPT